MNKQKRTRLIGGVELTWYIIAAILAVSGLVLSIFSLIGDYLQVPASENWIVEAQQAVIDWSKIEFDWLIWGTILMAGGLIISVITLLVYAKRVITEKEKALRRAQRLGGEIVSNQ